jgi:hypothetical protein
MGHNQNPHAHVKKKKKDNGVPAPVAVNSEGYFAPSKSNTEALNEVKNQ